MKYRLLLTLVGSVLLLALTAGTLSAVEQTADFESVPVKGMVTMIDLGAKKCIPCKMMAPIMEKIDKIYEGKAAIIFIDVWQHREQSQRFGLRAIPTQIFFDSDGKEIYRHVGFMAEEDIIAQLEKMGVQRGESSGG
ncbi:MAG TPA: thioredoxin family protein [Syntrophales bacterium]|nr:thioredoxin family protein [Syntrophales bacterium]HPQ45338.1 thioredoxin family protein [Syntrophales bacterium]